MVGWFWIETYEAAIHVLWPHKEEKRVTSEHIAGYLNRTFGIDDYKGDGDFNGRCTEVVSASGLKGAHVITLAFWDGSPKCHGVLAHEVFHAVEQILSHRGVPMTNDTSEPWAYLLGSVHRQCLNMIMKKGRK